MNKAELVNALTRRLGSRAVAVAALDAVLAEIQAQVAKGEKVSIPGFGVFERRVRGARAARNPRTGELVAVEKKPAPTFRAGAGFKDAVARGKAAKASGGNDDGNETESTGIRKPAAKKAASKKTSGKKTPAKKNTAVMASIGRVAKQAGAQQ